MVGSDGLSRSSGVEVAFNVSRALEVCSSTHLSRGLDCHGLDEPACLSALFFFRSPIRTPTHKLALRGDRQYIANLAILYSLYQVSLFRLLLREPLLWW